MAWKIRHFVIVFSTERTSLFHSRVVPSFLFKKQDCTALQSKLTSYISQGECMFEMSGNLLIYKDEETKSKFLSFYKKSLAAWPVPYEEFMVQTRYGDTHVIASGPIEKDPIVLIHAAGVNGTMWVPNISAFSHQYRVYALDTIGDFGKSILNDSKLYPKSAQDYCRWLIDVFDGLGISQASVVGSSMGGWITHGAAIFAPERIKKIVLLDPAAGIPTTTRWAGMFLSATIFPFKFNYRNISRKVLGNKQSEGKELWFDYMVTAFCSKSKAKPRLGLPSKFSDELLSHTKAPTLLLIGQNEVIYGSIDATVERAKKLISNIQTEIIPDAGHLPNIDQPEIVNTHILKFLAE
jgi:pimeloyl-ACP methyl ester carboxylesterase